MKYIITILMAIVFMNLFAQNIDCIDCNDSSKLVKYNSIINNLKNNTYTSKTSANNCRLKTVRVNIHFFQDDNGGNNFSRSGNGFTGFTGKNGVQIAEDLIGQLNAIYQVNHPQRIPLNNNIPVEDKEIQFLIDGIYFIQNSRLNKFNDTV